jgi:hypothetical protein
MMMMMMMFAYIDFIHNKKLENYTPYVKYETVQKGISKKKAIYLIFFTYISV